MSLIRLLTTTRSLSDVKNEPSPYRMTEQGLLPKFGPRKAASQSAGEEKENLGEGRGDCTDAGCSLKLESSRKPRGLTSWWQKLFGRRPRQEPVQAEFALDLVRVVRNELREAEAMAAAREKKKNTPKPEHRQVEDPPVEESVFGASRG
jgi:hypothetical protein